MRRHDGGTAISMPHKMMASFDANHSKARPPQRGNDFTATGVGEGVAYSNRDTLHTNELRFRRQIAFDLQAQLNGLSNPFHEFVERPSLRVATGQLRNAGNIITILIPLDDNVELAFFEFSHINLMPENYPARKQRVLRC